MTAQKKKPSLSMSRWQVSDRGNVAHIRIGTDKLTVCGEAFSKTAKLISPGGNNPPCLRCNETLQAARREAQAKAAGA